MKRIPELDGVRGVAALAVLAYHLRPNDYAFGTVNLGWAAVNLFMVLSGYLITTIILDHRRERSFLRTFYVRRGLRTWPVYYVTLLFFVVIDPFLPRPFGRGNVPYYLVYLQNTLLARPFSVPFNPALDHTWSLAVEEQFYLVWPLLIGLAGARGLVPLACVAVGVSAWVRWLGWHPWLLTSRFDGFALGGLLAAFFRDGAGPATGRRRHVGRLAFGVAIPLGCVLALPFWGRSLQVDVLVLNALLFAAVGVVLSCEGHSLLLPLRSRPLRYVGAISYGLYLYHYGVYWFFGGCAVTFDQPWPLDALKLGVTFALAALSWERFERPILGLKDRLRYGESDAPAPAEGDA